MLAHSPSIVTRNLLLNLDFGNIQKCYNGSENLVTYSEQFNNAAWSKANVGITTNTTATLAPDGTYTAEKLVENTANEQHLIFQSTPVTVGSVYTLSCFVKAAERTQVSLTAFGEGYSAYDLSNGTIIQTGNNVVSITPYGNGWYRCVATITKTNTTGNFYIIIWNNTNSYTGDGTSGIYIWGAQLERGYTASPYVQTVASTVTRPTTATSTVSNYSHTINNPQYISYDGATNSIRFDRNETFANFTGSITSNVLTVTAMSGINTITNGSALSYTGITSTRVITSFGTGIGTTGTYNVSAGIDTTSRAMSAAYKIGGNISVNTVGILTYNIYLYNDHTTEVWARINDRNPAQYDGFEGESALATFAGYHSMFLYGASYLRYYIWDNTGPTNKWTTDLTIGTSGTDIIQGQWFHVAVTKSGTTYKTYLNGVLKKTDTITSTALSGVGNNLRIGSAFINNTDSYNYYAKNNIGCVKMYNATLSADEITQNFNALRGRYLAS